MTELPSYVFDKDELKGRLNVTWVAAEYGVLFDESGRALCPFHDDQNNPNLELMPPGEDGYPWWYCRACGEAGDVIRFIEKVKGLTFNAAMIAASKLYERQPAEFEAAIPERRTRYEVNPSWEEKLREYEQRARNHLDVGLLSFSYGITTEETPDEERRAWDAVLLDWGWCLDPVCNVVIPHRAKDRALRAVKVKKRDGSWNAYGKLDALYGCWRPREFPQLVLCEGESDTVWASKQGGHDVLGVPAGASSFNSQWLDDVGTYDTVFLAFDNDSAGNRAAKKWADVLSDMDVRRIPLPWGCDLRASQFPLEFLVSEAVPVGEWRENELEREVEA